MKIVVTLDEDGHFITARIDDRKSTFNLLRSIDDGDYYEEECDIQDIPCYNSAPSFKTLDDTKWIYYLNNFVKRGTFEILDI